MLNIDYLFLQPSLVVLECPFKELLETMNTAEFDFSFLEEGFSAKDIVEQKINELSMTVRSWRGNIYLILRCFCYDGSVSNHCTPSCRMTGMPSMCVTWGTF